MRTMAERYSRPDWVRRLHAMAASVGGEARDLVPLDPDALLEAALREDGGPHWSMVAQLEGFTPDVDVFYDFHRRLLRVLQHGDTRPGRTWLLKTPGHVAALEALFATYPDAWVVQTHRDPAKTMPSTASITAMVQWMRTDPVDLPSLCAVIEAVFTAALNGSVALRDGGAVPDRFVDVHFRDLLAEPVETQRRAYAAMGRELGAAHAERITRYLREKPRGKLGRHRYTPQEWGYAAGSLRGKLAAYVDRSGIALE